MRGPLGPKVSVRISKMCLSRELTLISGGSQDNRQVESLTNGSVGHRLMMVQSRIPISGQLVKAFLDIDHEENLKALAY